MHPASAVEAFAFSFGDILMADEVMVKSFYLPIATIRHTWSIRQSL